MHCNLWSGFLNSDSSGSVWELIYKKIVVRNPKVINSILFKQMSVSFLCNIYSLRQERGNIIYKLERQGYLVKPKQWLVWFRILLALTFSNFRKTQNCPQITPLNLVSKKSNKLCLWEMLEEKLLVVCF